MKKVGQELVLGEFDGYLQVFNIRKLEITHTQQFEEEIGRIYDIIAIENSQHLLLAGYRGLLKATQDQVIKHYFQGQQVISICHAGDSIYLVGFYNDGLIVWNEQTNQQLFQICQDIVCSIKRVGNTNTYIIKTKKNGLKLLTIKNLKTAQFSLQHLLEAKEEVYWTYTDSLQVSYAPNSHIVIATTQNERQLGEDNRSILLMKVSNADI